MITSALEPFAPVGGSWENSFLYLPAQLLCFLGVNITAGVNCISMTPLCLEMTSSRCVCPQGSMWMTGGMIIPVTCVILLLAMALCSGAQAARVDIVADTE